MPGAAKRRGTSWSGKLGRPAVRCAPSRPPTAMSRAAWLRASSAAKQRGTSWVGGPGLPAVRCTSSSPPTAVGRAAASTGHAARRAWRPAELSSPSLRDCSRAHLFASATHLAMHASRFGSMLKNCARHSAVQARRLASHAVCAAAPVPSGATRRRTKARSGNKELESLIDQWLGRMHFRTCAARAVPPVERAGERATRDAGAWLFQGSSGMFNAAAPLRGRAVDRRRRRCGRSTPAPRRTASAPAPPPGGSLPSKPDGSPVLAAGRAG